MRLLLVAVVALAFAIPGKAQLTYKERIELELKDGYAGEQIFEFAEKGIILSSVNEDSDNGKREWKFEKYNKDLKPVKTESSYIDKKFYLDQTFYDKERLHLFLKNNKGEFSIITVNAETMELHTIDGFMPKKSFIWEMAVLGDFAYFKSHVKKVPFLFSVNWKNGQQKPIEVKIKGFKPKRVEIVNFQLMEDQREILAYIRASMNKNESDTYVIKFDENGKQKGLYNLTEKVDKNIINISASSIGDDKYIFTGTYADKMKSLSEGIFFCKAANNVIDEINFYNFLDLENFLTYLPEKKQEKIERKKERKENRGKELNLNYFIASHEIITLDDGYLLLGEAYYPTYRTESYTTFINGVHQTHYRSVFDGYRYTHAILSKFNKSGELEWDETFKMYPSYKPYLVKRFISISEQDKNSLKMVFASEDKILSKVIDMKGTVLQDKESTNIETTYSGDKSKSSFSNINYWYGNNFIAYGRQKIKNKEDEEVKNKRKVFFISKIQFN